MRAAREQRQWECDSDHMAPRGKGPTWILFSRLGPEFVDLCVSSSWCGEVGHQRVSTLPQSDRVLDARTYQVQLNLGLIRRRVVAETEQGGDGNPKSLRRLQPLRCSSRDYGRMNVDKSSAQSGSIGRLPEPPAINPPSIFETCEVRR